MLMHLGWVDSHLEVPPCCLAAQPLMPNYHQPKQNSADCGTNKIKVNLTQASEQMNHPVQLLISRCIYCSILV